MAKHSSEAGSGQNRSVHSAPHAAESTVVWLDDPEEHDYPAAADYLSLLADTPQVELLVAAFRAAPAVERAAKDLLRSTRLPLLPPDDQHVAADLDKVRAGRPLSPVLFVRGSITQGCPAVIADGYHRVCASYHTNANTPVRVRIVDLPAVAP
jgi:hypothetical protein